MTTTRPAWAYTLPAASLLMAPFHILASLAMDIYLPVVPAMPGRPEHDSIHNPTHVEPLHGDARCGPSDLWATLRSRRATADPAL